MGRAEPHVRDGRGAQAVDRPSNESEEIIAKWEGYETRQGVHCHLESKTRIDSQDDGIGAFNKTCTLVDSHTVKQGLEQ